MSGSSATGEWTGQRVLVLAPTPTHPQDYGNRKRIFRVCERIASSGGRICFVHYPAEAEWRRAIPWNADHAMKRTWPGYFTVAPTRDLHPAPGQMHHDIDAWWDNNIGVFLRWLFAVQSFDAFIVNYAWLSKAFEYAPPSVLKVLDTHDKLSGRRELLEANGIPPEFFFTTEEEEARALRRADVVWAIKDEERLAFGQLTQSPVLTLPHIDDLVSLGHRAPDQNGYLRVGFLGARNTINRVSIQSFLREAIPIFRSAFAPIKILIAGSVCDQIELADSPFVEVIGRVCDVEQFYASVDCVVVPMTFSTGLKIKTGEALSFGMPVIATSHAFEGYQAAHEFHSLKNFREIANALVEISFDRAKLTALEVTSQRSQQVTAQLTSQTLSRTRELVREHQQSLVFAVDSRAFLAGTVFNLVLHSAIDYLRFLADVTVLVVAGSARDLVNGKAVADQVPRIVVAADLPCAEECRSALGEMSIDILAAEEFLRDKAAKAVVADAWHPAFGEPWRANAVVFVRPEMIAFSSGTSKFRFPSHRSQRQFVVSNVMSREIAGCMATDGASLVLAPCLYKTPAAWQIQFRTAAQPTVVILGSPVTAATALALAWAQAWKMRAHVVVGVGEGAGLPEFTPAEFTCSSAPAFVVRLLGGKLEKPLFALDASAGRAGLQLCRELLERSGVAVVCAAQVAAQPATAPASNQRVSTDLELAQLFRRFALDPNSIERDAFARAQHLDYECDAGWAYIWAFCKSLEQSKDAVFS